MVELQKKWRFKPYYKWITFNTFDGDVIGLIAELSFKPYYKWITFNTMVEMALRIRGVEKMSFKPYYKWITFNTLCWDNL